MMKHWSIIKDQCIEKDENLICSCMQENIGIL